MTIATKSRTAVMIVVRTDGSTQAEVQVELVIEPAERRDECLNGHRGEVPGLVRGPERQKELGVHAKPLRQKRINSAVL